MLLHRQAHSKLMSPRDQFQIGCRNILLSVQMKNMFLINGLEISADCQSGLFQLDPLLQLKGHHLPQPTHILLEKESQFALREEFHARLLCNPDLELF